MAGPASSMRHFTPLAVRACATMPPEAPEPMISTSWSLVISLNREPVSIESGCPTAPGGSGRPLPRVDSRLDEIGFGGAQKAGEWIGGFLMSTRLAPRREKSVRRGGPQPGAPAPLFLSLPPRWPPGPPPDHGF